MLEEEPPSFSSGAVKQQPDPQLFVAPIVTDGMNGTTLTHVTTPQGRFGWGPVHHMVRVDYDERLVEDKKIPTVEYYHITRPGTCFGCGQNAELAVRFRPPRKEKRIRQFGCFPNMDRTEIQKLLHPLGKHVEEANPPCACKEFALQVGMLFLNPELQQRNIAQSIVGSGEYNYECIQ
eukprot:TRINITY_DN66883_c5_g1_i1.p1 TRINITY_DN66883_c5_g1~~TRINITY_DN66883_c5_g1_i1.p1  ORF type:complete len:186 (+),score=5.59 TRINITY_DN66883_c5_g1_i1:27-560(+)